MHALPVSLEGVTLKTNRGVRLLDDVSFTVEPAERCVIVGPNGAGKSTLLAVIAGRLRPTAGRVLVGEQDVHQAQAPRARRIATVGQNESADLRLGLGDYVALGRVPHQHLSTACEHREAVTRAMTACGLKGWERRSIHTLSGGERQRAHLARALAQEPALQLLDEPTNHLDLRARIDLLDLVHGLRMTVVVSLHELSLVSGFADRVVMLEHGRSIASGSPAETLSEQRVAEVFDLSLVRVRHPQGDRELSFFEKRAAC